MNFRNQSGEIVGFKVYTNSRSKYVGVNFKKMVRGVMIANRSIKVTKSTQKSAINKIIKYATEKTGIKPTSKDVIDIKSALMTELKSYI